MRSSEVFRLGYRPHWDDKVTEELLKEGWAEHVPQRFIKERSRTMVDRFNDVFTLEGQMTGY